MAKHRYCSNCQKNVRAEKNQPKHVIHIIVTICTAGLWGLVYGWLIGWYLFAAHYKCTECGHSVKRAKSLEKISVIKAKSDEKINRKLQKVYN